jgi:hypothetical protein
MRFYPRLHPFAALRSMDIKQKRLALCLEQHLHESNLFPENRSEVIIKVSIKCVLSKALFKVLTIALSCSTYNTLHIMLTADRRHVRHVTLLRSLMVCLSVIV